VQQFGHLGDLRRDPPRLVARENPDHLTLVSETFLLRQRLQRSNCVTGEKSMLRKSLIALVAIVTLGLDSTAIAKHGGGHSTRHGGHGGGGYSGGGYSGGGYGGGHGDRAQRCGP
jgi:uncharacterized membrane protein